MAIVKKLSKERWIWISILLIVLIGGMTFYLWPDSFPNNESQRLINESANYDAIIIFNPGGWGNSTLAQATDFTPILEEMKQTLSNMGYPATIIPYRRTASGFSGILTGIKEYLRSYKSSARVQAKDLQLLAETYPEKSIIIAGFSNGGGLTDATLENLSRQVHTYAIVAGVPFWHHTFSAKNSLVLNNSGRDPLAAGDIWRIAVNVIKAPYRFIHGKLTGQDISISTSFHFPGHEYEWSSPEVGKPIIQFLENNLKVN